MVEVRGAEQVSIEWDGGGEREKSVDIMREYSFELEGSVKGASKTAVAKESLKATMSVEQSFSFGNLNTGTQSWSASTGVTLNRGLGVGDAGDTAFKYAGNSFIYTLQKSTGKLVPDSGRPPSLDNIVATGPLKVRHVANVLTDQFSGGLWWVQRYTKPDLALNHPKRWKQRLPEASVPQLIKFNCPIGFDSDFEEPEESPGICTPAEDEIGVVITPTPTPSNVAIASFYHMKGLFVTSADSTTGPASQLATLGDTLTIQARVYNYSLKNMPFDASVHVAFFAQPWDAIGGQFTAGDGNFGFAKATLIDKIAIGPVPAYCGGSQGFDSCFQTTLANWVMATVQWDTSTIIPQPTNNTDWKFWVVVWMEDGAYNLLEEIEHHGLTAIPQVDVVASLADIPIETYSNNLGFYDQKFTLLLPAGNPPASLTAPGPLTASDQQEDDLTIREIEHELSVAELHSESIIRVHYDPGPVHRDRVEVMLYEGDPQDGGQLLDVEQVPFMQKDENHVVHFPYTAGVCGAHELFIETFRIGGGLTEIETLAFDILCKPSLIANFRGTAKSAGNGNSPKDSLHLTGEFTLNRPLSLPALDLAAEDAEVTVENLLDEVGGNGELVDWLPLTLEANPRNGDHSAQYETSYELPPFANLSIVALQPGTYRFKLKLNKATINRAADCPKTNLLTRFTIDDGSAVPVIVLAEAQWSCNGRSGGMQTKESGR